MAQAGKRYEAERGDKVGRGRGRANICIRSGRRSAGTIQHHNSQFERCKYASGKLIRLLAVSFSNEPTQGAYIPV